MQTNSNPASNKGIKKTLTDMNESLAKGLTD